jgi:NADPH:quinone reductase-like Zn-dependent oxidoreductase
VKAVWYEETGAAPDVLTFGDLPTPVAGPGEVRVRLHASGVNPSDAGRRAGSYRAMEFPRVIANSDGAGIVDQLGTGVTRFQIGQAVQLAKGGGARVIATVSSPRKAEQARLAGADLVIDYKTEDVVARALDFTARRGVNRVVDVDFGGKIATTLKLMAVNSTIAVYATNGNRNPVVPMRELMEKCIALRALVLPALPPPLHAAAQADISKWLSEGKRIHNIAAQFPLSETAQAHLAVEKGDKLGTVIVDCAR